MRRWPWPSASAASRETSPQRIVEHLDLDDFADAPEISGPGFLNITLRRRWIAAQVTRCAADARLGVPTQHAAGHPDRLLRAQRGQGDARRPPAHHRRRRRARPHAGAPRPPRRPAEPPRRLGHAVRHAHRAPARRRRGLRRGAAAGDRPERLLPGGARRSSTPTRTFATRARRAWCTLQAGDPDTLRLWDELVDLSKRYFNRIYTDARRHPHRRRPRRREHYNHELAGDLRRARGARASRRSATARCASSSPATPAARASRSR